MALQTSNVTQCGPQSETSVLELETAVSNEANSIVCENGQPCIILECTINGNWEKNQEVDFAFEMEFQAKLAKQDDNTEFSIYSMASVDDEMNYAMTKMTTGQLGAVEQLAQNWPIVLGVGLGLLFTVGTILILWKTGILAKLRPYKVDEEEIKAERRKSHIRMSIRYSEMADQNE